MPKGIKGFQKGVKLSEEHKRKISEAMKGKIPLHFKECQKKGWEANRGKHLSNECKRKISLALKGIIKSSATRLKLSLANSEYKNRKTFKIK